MIYLDSAATSLQKPPSVGIAMLQALRACASPGRGVHAPAMRAAETALRCREEAAALFHMPEPENVVFTHNATHGLNIAIRSLVKPGMPVAVSGFEHNAVMRPLYALGAEIRTAEAPLFDPEGTVEAFRRVLPGAGAAVCTHVSNVFGYRLPLYKIAEACRESGVPLIVDAAQSAGSEELDFPRTGAAFCAMPGHKGLLGPQGTGLLLCRAGGLPLLFGGTGGGSESRDMPPDLPDRLEAGTLNICGIAGLLEGIRYVRTQTPRAVGERETALREELSDGLRSLAGLRLYTGGEQRGILSVVPEAMSCEELAERLNTDGVYVRSGLHCAPAAHRSAGTLSTGTVRMSVSSFNSEEEIRQVLARMEKYFKKA
ncbi:MAG: aminotransferase class V-fold PLP-dependent enzyme [Oscillospiraceae bacterium]|nr:aminotransferase class V-fold PLP-dependent enzyme [Oscillospiraceae bacterium]